MPLFDAFVVRHNCVRSLDAVRDHPNVKRVISLPHEWILYEFHDTLFQDPDYLVEGVWEQKMQQRSDLRASRINMLAQERGLLSPWYEARPKLGDADNIVISEICEYRLYSLNPMRWVEFEPSSGWGVATDFSIVVRVSEESQAELFKMIDEWELASKSHIRVVGRMNPFAGEVRLRVQCRDYGGHWIIGFWTLVSDGRFKAGVSKVMISVNTLR